MSDIGTNYRVEIEILSPVHIGSGRPDLQDDLDYVRSRQIYVIDEARMLADLPDDRLARAEEGVPLSTLLHADEYSRYARYALNDPTGGTERVPRIVEQVKDARGQAVIPGSTLKGSIRTALAWSMLRETGTQVRVNELQRSPRFADAPLENRFFGKTPHEDLLRVMHVMDSQPPADGNALELLQVTLHSLRNKAGGVALESKGDRWSFFVEALAGGTRLETTVRLDDYLLQPEHAGTLGFWDKRKWVQGWVTYCNEFSQAVIAREADFYTQHNLPRVKAFYDQLENRAEDVEPGRECLLQIAWGTGWRSKTVGTALDDKTLRQVRDKYGLGRRGYSVFPKSRRVVIRGNVAEMPLGWILLRLVDLAEEPFVPDVELEPLPKRGKPAEPPAPPPGGPRRIEDLEPGIVLEGTVEGITDFGAFVDIGVGRNGLVHISELTEGWVNNVSDVVQRGQRVRVRVLDVDVGRQRISLSMKGLPQP